MEIEAQILIFRGTFPDKFNRFYRRDRSTITKTHFHVRSRMFIRVMKLPTYIRFPSEHSTVKYHAEELFFLLFVPRFNDKLMRRYFFNTQMWYMRRKFIKARRYTYLDEPILSKS